MPDASQQHPESYSAYVAGDAAAANSAGGILMVDQGGETPSYVNVTQT